MVSVPLETVSSKCMYIFTHYINFPHRTVTLADTFYWLTNSCRCFLPHYNPGLSLQSSQDPVLILVAKDVPALLPASVPSLLSLSCFLCLFYCHRMTVEKLLLHFIFAMTCLLVCPFSLTTFLS